MISLCLLRFAAILVRTSSAVKTAGVSVCAGLVGSIGGIGAGLDGGGSGISAGLGMGSSIALLAFLVFEKIAIIAVD